MKTASTNLIAVVMIGVAYFATTSAFACGGGGHHGGHHGHHGHHHHHAHHGHHGHHHNHGHHYHTPIVKYYTPPAPVSTCSLNPPIVTTVVPQVLPAPVVNYAPAVPSVPSASISLAAPEPTRLQVPAGSALMVNGQLLGQTKGSVRIRIDTLTIPVEVLDWSASAARVQLPKMDLAGPMKAELEVFRADGNVASSTPIEVTPAAERLALSK